MKRGRRYHWDNKRAGHVRTAAVALWVVMAAGLACADGVYFEAEECATNSPLAPLVVTNTGVDAAFASRGAYLFCAATSNDYYPADGKPGQAWYAFSVPSTTNVALWLRTQNSGSEGFFFKLNSDLYWTEVNNSNAGATNEPYRKLWGHDVRWEWRQITNYATVAAGAYTLKIQKEDMRFMFDAVYLAIGTSDGPVSVDPHYYNTAQRAYFEVEAPLWRAALGAWQHRGDISASGGACLQNTADNADTNATSGLLAYAFTTIEPHTAFEVWARVKLPQAGAQSLFYRFDQEPWRPIAAGVCTNWSWLKLGFHGDRPAGVHHISILARDAGVLLDQVYATTYGMYPGAHAANVVMEAEQAAALAPFNLQSDATASNGLCIAYEGPEMIPQDAACGQAHYSFTLAANTNVAVWLRIKAARTGSINFAIDGAAWRAYRGSSANWSWKYAGTISNLPAGPHSFKLQKGFGALGGFGIDQIFLTGEGATPPAAPGKPGTNVYFEAENVSNPVTLAPVVVAGDVRAAAGGYVEWPGTGQQDTTPSDADSGQMWYPFVLESMATDVAVWLRVKFASGDDNGVYYKIDGLQDWTAYDGPAAADWSWQQVGGAPTMEAGAYLLRLLKRKDGAQIDQVALITDGSDLSGQPALPLTWYPALPYWRTNIFYDDQNNTIVAPENAWEYSGLPPQESAWTFDAEECVNLKFGDFDDLFRPWQVVADADARGGQCVTWPGAGQVNGTPADSTPGQMHWRFTLYSACDVSIYGRVKCADGNDDAFFCTLAGVSDWASVDGLDTGGAWQWRLLGTYINVAPGECWFKVQRGEDGACMDQIRVVCVVQDAATVRYIAPPPLGSDMNAGSAAAPWASLEKAFAEGQAGQTMYARQGYWAINAGLNFSNYGNPAARITLAGYPGERPLLDAERVAYPINLRKPSTRFSNLHVLKAPGKCIGLFMAPDLEVTDCSTWFTMAGGIFVEPNDYRGARIVGNRVMWACQDWRDQEQMHVWGIFDFEIAYNELAFGGKEAIDCLGGGNGSIHHNYCHDHRHGAWGTGIYLDAASGHRNISIHHNVINDVEEGICLGVDNNNLMDGIEIHHNLVRDFWWGGGISLGAMAKADDFSRWTNFRIYNNTIYHGGAAGITITYTNIHNLVVRNNVTTDCGLTIDTRINRATQNVLVDCNLTNVQPGYLDITAGNFHLATNISVAVDAGHPDPQYNDPDGTRNDIGAYFLRGGAGGAVLPQDMLVREYTNFMAGNTNWISAGDSTPGAAEGTEFGAVNVAYGWRERVFAIHSSGGAAVTLDGVPAVSVGGAQAAEFTVLQQPASPLPPGAQASFTLRFDPAATGVRRATVSIPNNVSGKDPYTFDICGTGIVSAAGVEVRGNGVTIVNGDDEPGIDDGTCVGAAAVQAELLETTFMLFNRGGLDLAATVQINGTHSGDFAVAGSPVVLVAPGTASALRVQFSPRAYGMRRAMVRISSNDPDQGQFSFGLQGLGTGLPFLQTGGIVSVEAEHMSVNAAGAADYTGIVWIAHEDANASAGMHMSITNGNFMGDGRTPLFGTFNDAPRMEFAVQFSALGPHYFWARRAVMNTNRAWYGNSDDSCRLAYDNVIWHTWDHMTNESNIVLGNRDVFSFAWDWVRCPRPFTNTSLGVHTVSVYLREDGLKLDKFVWTTNPNYLPGTDNGGLGPDESPRLPEPALLGMLCACAAARRAPHTLVNCSRQ